MKTNEIKYINEFLETSDNRVTEFEDLITELKLQYHESNVDHFKRNHISFKFVPKKGLSVKKLFALHFNRNVGNLFREHKDTKIETGTYYYSIKRKNGNLLKIEYTENKSFITTFINKKSIYKTEYRMVSILGIKKLCLWVHTFAEMPLSFFSLNTTISKLNVIKEFKSMFKKVKKYTKENKNKIKNLEAEEIMFMNLN